VELHPVVVAQPMHKAARRRGQARLVMPDEADDVAERRVRLPIHRWRNNPRRGHSLYVRRQLPAVHKLAQGEVGHRRTAPRQWVQHHDWLGRGHCGWWQRAKTKRAAGECKGASGRETKSRSEKQRMLCVEVRDSSLPLLRFIDPGEPRSPNRTH
jgi:hypothetical protein